MTCSACNTADHPREAHDCPTLALLQAAECEDIGDDAGAAMWREVARVLELRRAQ